MTPDRATISIYVTPRSAIGLATSSIACSNEGMKMLQREYLDSHYHQTTISGSGNNQGQGSKINDQPLTVLQLAYPDWDHSWHFRQSNRWYARRRRTFCKKGTIREVKQQRSKIRINNWSWYSLIGHDPPLLVQSSVVPCQIRFLYCLESKEEITEESSLKRNRLHHTMNNRSRNVYVIITSQSLSSHRTFSYAFRCTVWLLSLT